MGGVYNVLCWYSVEIKYNFKELEQQDKVVSQGFTLLPAASELQTSNSMTRKPDTTSVHGRLRDLMRHGLSHWFRGWSERQREHRG